MLAKLAEAKSVPVGRGVDALVEGGRGNFLLFQIPFWLENVCVHLSKIGSTFSAARPRKKRGRKKEKGSESFGRELLNSDPFSALYVSFENEIGMKSRSRLMLEKSIAAIISAIEIYNKPDFKYREETFSVLCINSWELLLKSKILNLASNKVASLYVMEFRQLKTGKKSTVLRPKPNRSGNPHSIGLFEAYRVITQDYGVKIDRAIYDNLIALTEVRDNSIHFVNDDLMLSLKIQELGTASLQNYLHLVRQWFGDVLSGYNFYLMPLSFFRDFNLASVVVLNSNERNVLKYINEVEKRYETPDEIRDFNLTLRIDVKFQKVKVGASFPVQVSNDPNAPLVRLSEEDLTDKYPWDYDVLTTRLRKRYSNFKVNNQYHEIRRSLESDARYAHARFLNPNNKNGGKKILYNPNIQKEFDKHYLKGASQSAVQAAPKNEISADQTD